MARLPDRGADAVVVDLEDATPPSAKEEARTNVRSILPSIIGGAPQVFIRVNAVDSPWFEADIAEGLVDGLSGIVVPKIETTFQLDQVQDELQKNEHPDLRVLSGIETALGVADTRVLLAHPIVMAAYFGAEDFIEDMGGVRTRGGEEARTRSLRSIGLPRWVRVHSNSAIDWANRSTVSVEIRGEFIVRVRSPVNHY